MAFPVKRDTDESSDYQRRFGPHRTRSDADSSQPLDSAEKLWYDDAHVSTLKA